LTTIAPYKPAPGWNRAAVVSPLLANLYLHPLDQVIEQDGWRMVRYADDL
jgi:RNA-directed DNA polymerase